MSILILRADTVKMIGEWVHADIEMPAAVVIEERMVNDQRYIYVGQGDDEVFLGYEPYSFERMFERDEHGNMEVVGEGNDGTVGGGVGSGG